MGEAKIKDHLVFSQERAEHRKAENFPVASILMPKFARDDIVTFYNFARHADDIADNGNIPKEERHDALVEIDVALTKNKKEDLPDWALPYLNIVEKGNVSLQHGRDLLSAFTQDTVQDRYEDWDDLIGYCMRSAAPVGRAVLEINKEEDADIDSSDKICNVLQILNHLQDLKIDYTEKDRVYFPEKWLGDLENLAGQRESKEIRETINKSLDRVDDMLISADNLPETLKSLRLRSEIAVIIEIAHALSKKLRDNDPIAYRVKLSKIEKAICFAKGISRAIGISLGGDNVAYKITKMSKTSFFLPLMLLPKEKREAMFSLYAFCRVADDAADEAESEEQAIENINYWRDQIRQLYEEDNHDELDEVTRSLVPHVKFFELERAYFEEILYGQEMDATGKMLKPSEEQLDKYCYRVASAVGLLSIQIFGYQNRQSEEFAIELGKALQHINILRDVVEDAERGRIYLPAEELKKQGLKALKPEDLLDVKDENKQKIQAVLAHMVTKAQTHIDNAMEALPTVDRKSMKAGLMMLGIYKQYLRIIKTREWYLSDKKTRLTSLHKIYFSLRSLKS